MVTASPALADVHAILDTVVDPEIPVLTIADLGVLRRVEVGEGGVVHVVITPTYSGCPAMEVIESDIVAALARSGHIAHVETVFSPAWTTDWMSEEAKAKLAAFGIAPPGGVLDVVDEVLCPNCAASTTTVISEFGSTACKRMLRCTTCGEPFDQFKAI